MKNLLPFIFLSVITLTGLTNKKEKNVPDLLIQINDTTFIDKYEITIQDYRYFLFDKATATHNIHSIDSLLPNPNYVNWYDGYWKFNKIYEVTDTNFSYPVPMWFLPIINISKKQAEEYCEWRTRNWQKIYEHMPTKDKAKYYRDIIFRLPDYSEWLSAASSGLDTMLYPTGKIKKTKRNSLPVCLDYFTLAQKDSGEVMPQGGAEPWQFGIKNDMGVFNMCGDVAEFLRDKNFVAGGSFRDSLSACKVSSTKTFNKPNDWTGFRCIAIINRQNSE